MKNRKMILAAVSILLIMAAAIAVMSNKDSDTDPDRTAISQDLTDEMESDGEEAPGQ